jgi:hypothetical protein
MAITTNIHHKDTTREHLLFSDHLTAADFDSPIRETFLGQAHIAGTGPEGRTCRECVSWHQWKYDKSRDDFIPCSPGFFSKRHKAHPLEPKKAYCTRPIANKAKRLIPHSAKSCRLFEPAEKPVPARKPE